LFAVLVRRCIFASSNKQQLTFKANNMKKIIILAASVIGFAANANAQATSTANQNVSLALTNAIAITFTGSGTATGTAVSIPFTTVSDYTNGVSSTAQQLKVQSNKAFNITVAASAANFTFTGTATPTPTMPVSGVLGIEVSANATGATIASPFSATAYATLTSASQSLLTGGTYGGNQLFSVIYQSTPGFAYPAGTYTTNVVYTATQP